MKSDITKKKTDTAVDSVQSDKFFAEQLEAHYGSPLDGFLVLSDGIRIRKSAVVAYRREGLFIRFLLTNGIEHSHVAADDEHAVLVVSRLDILFESSVF